jgi:carbonic anhydrase
MSSDVWSQLAAGVERSSERRSTGVPEHRPAAVILTCSDARVAGNTLSSAARARFEYAVDAIRADPGALGDSVRAGSLDLRGAIHDLHTGHLDQLTSTLPLQEP